MEPRKLSIRQLMDRIRRHPMLQEIPLETVIDYTVDFFRIVGLPTTFEEKTEVLDVHKYRAKLPNDFHEMVQVRTVSKNPIYFRYSTDTFHMSKNHADAEPFTYKIQGGIIYTSMNIGEIEISYLALETDECGLPMVPDNSNFLRALENYIKLQHFTILFDMGKLDPRILQNAEKEYCWAVGACECEFHMLSLDKAESVANMYKSLIIKDSEHHRGYATSGTKEYIKIHDNER